MPTPTSTQKQHLIIRAPNWIGDVVLCLTTWQRLAQTHTLHIIGKRWLADLVSGYPDWHIYILATKKTEIRQQYAQLKDALIRQGVLAKGVNSIVFPTSFSFVFQPWRAGLKSLGQSHEGRGWFLKKSIPMPHDDVHIHQRHWDLADAFYNRIEPAPAQINFVTPLSAQVSARKKRLTAHLTDGEYVVICPFAGGLYKGKSKLWPYHSELAKVLQGMGIKVICCPSPSEASLWQENYANIQPLWDVGLAEYAAILEHARFVVANDTGPGHLAAAVGTPLVSIFNNNAGSKYKPVGAQVSAINSSPDWATLNEVLEHLQSRFELTDTV